MTRTRSWIRVALVAAATAVGTSALTVAAAAQGSGPAEAPDVYTLSSGRITGAVGVVTALVGAIIGGLALARPGRRGAPGGRRRAVVAVVLGLAGVVVGGMVVATAQAGVGTGHGLGGGIVAIGVGVLGAALGGLALLRARTNRASHPVELSRGHAERPPREGGG